MYIILEAEFTLCFGDWHWHYSAYEYDYAVMKSNIAAILENQKES